MSRDVIDLAREDTQLKKVSVNELAGPCPGCGGRDRFHVHLAKRDGRGAWMCRVCHPAEEMGWGDAIEYLRKFRTMSFVEAKAYLQDGLDSLIERVDQGIREVAPDENKPPKEQWQERMSRYVDLAQHRLWKTPAGAACLEYLRVRGLQDATIKAARLGYAEDEEDNEVIPRLVIPWHADNGQYWAVNRRDLRENKPKDAPRYKMVAWSNRKAMYGCGLLTNTRRYLTFIVEGELDALILAQESGDLPINVVATGGDGVAAVKWLIRVSRMPLVLLAQDREQRGDELARKWMDALQGHAQRYRPLAKDVNAMLLEGWSVRTWVEAALDMLQPVEPANINRTLQSDSDQAPASSVATVDQVGIEQDPVIAPVLQYQDAGDLCITCLQQVEDRDGAFYVDESGDLYCMSCWNVRAQIARPIDEQDQVEQSGPVALQMEQPTTREQDTSAAFLDQVSALVADIWPDGFTLRLVDDAFAARIHALPDLPAIEPPKVRSILEALPRRACPFKHLNAACKPSPCSGKPRANGWCEQHQKSAILLDMGTALNYPRVEISDCNVIPASLPGWERYAAQSTNALNAALPRVKRLLDQVQGDQDQAAS